MQLSDDFETFLSFNCRFMFIYDKVASELENPLYILIQVYDNSKWGLTRCFKINDDIKKFYDKLSSKIVEIEDGGEKYVYETDNGSNEWELKSLKGNSTYQKYFRREDFENLIKDKKINII